MVKHSKSSKTNILSIGIITLLIFIPLYPKFPLINLPKTYVAIRVEDFVVAAILLVWFIHQLFNRFSSLKDRVGKLIILYWIGGALSSASAILITKNIIPHLVLIHYLRRIEYMSLFFVALASVKDIKTVKTYGWSLFLATIGVFVYGIGQKFWGWPVISTMNAEFSKGLLLQLSEWARISSTFAGHYDLAAFLVLVLAVIAGFAIGFKSRLAKLLTIAVGLLAFYLLILTASRVSFIAYLLAVIFVLVVLKKYRWIGPVVALSLVSMLLSTEFSQRYAATFKVNLAFLSSIIPQRPGAERLALVTTPTPTPPFEEEGPLPTLKPGEIRRRPARPIPTVATAAAKLEEWIPTTEVAVAYSSAIRFKVEWPRALRALRKNPFLGTGYSSVSLATDNDYLRLLAETGILGFVSFFLIFMEIGRRVIFFLKFSKNDFSKALVVGISGATLGMFANAIFIDVFEASKVAFIFWILMGILIGIMKLEPVYEKQNEKKN